MRIPLYQDDENCYQRCELRAEASCHYSYIFTLSLLTKITNVSAEQSERWMRLGDVTRNNFEHRFVMHLMLQEI
jgi:hypothetical protein